MKSQKNFIIGIFLVVAVLILSISTVSALTVEKVTSSPSEVAPGETATITIDLENNLEDTVKNINIALELTGEIPIAPYQSSSETFIDEIKDGKNEDVSFKIQVLPDAKAGVYKIPYTIEYEIEGNASGVQTKSGIISLTVNDKPYLELYGDESVIIKGTTNEVVIRIVNSGLSDVKLMSIETMDFNNIKIISEKKVYIGNLDSDDFDTAEFKISVPVNSPSIISLPITLTYRDFTNEQYTENIDLEVRAYTTEEAIRLGLIPAPNYTFVIVIVLVIIVYIIYRIIKGIKKKRRKKRAQQEA